MLIVNNNDVRMFSSSLDRHMMQCNEYGEYEVAKGVPSRLFAAILVRMLIIRVFCCFQGFKVMSVLHN